MGEEESGVKSGLGGGFIQLFSSSLLTAHPEPGSHWCSGDESRQWMCRMCVRILNNYNINNHNVLFYTYNVRSRLCFIADVKACAAPCSGGVYKQAG